MFSRYPIVEVSIKRFSANGKPQRIYHGKIFHFESGLILGDWLGGKAVGLCRIRHPLGLIDFYNTHVSETVLYGT